MHVSYCTFIDKLNTMRYPPKSKMLRLKLEQMYNNILIVQILME